MADKMLMRMENHMTKKDMELARSQVINIRSAGINSNIKELTETLRAGFPDISESVIAQIEEAPGYVQAVLNKQMGKIAAALPDIVDMLIVMSKNGNVKAIEQLKDLSGLSKKIITVNNVQNNLSLQGQPRDVIEAQFRELAAELD